MRYLKADTITKVAIGPFVDVTDGFTPETAVTLTGGGDNADEALIVKHDDATAVSIASNTWAAFSTPAVDGYYHLTLTATDTNTEGQLSVIIQNDSVHLPVVNHFQVVNANVYDSLFAAATTDYLQVDLLQVGGDSQSGTDLKDFADAGYDPATNKVEGVKLVDTTTTNTDMLTAAAVNAEVDTALADIKLDHLISAAVDTNLQTTVADDSVIGYMLASSVVSAYDRTTDSLEDLRDRGDAAWTTATGFSTHAAADVWTAVTRTLTAATNITSDASALNVTSGTLDLVTDITTKTGYSISGTLTTLDGMYLRVNTAQAGAAGTITLDASASATDDLYNGAWVSVVSGTGAGQARLIADYNGTTKVANISPNWITNPSSDSVFIVSAASELVGIDGTVTNFDGLNNLAATDILSDGTALNTSSGVLDAVTTVTTVSGNVDGSVGSLGTTAKTDVNAEVDSAIETYGLDHLVGAAVVGADITDNSIIAKLVSSSATADWDDFVNTTDSLQAQRDNHPANFADLSVTASTGRVDLAAWLGTAVTVSSTTGLPEVDTKSVSDDATAANNLELMFDGTGYAGGTTKLGVDVVSISGDTTAADNLEEAATAVVVSAVNDPGAAATTTAFITDLTETDDDHYNGKILTFTTGNLIGQSTDVTDYTGSTKTLTVTALTEAPADNDEFVLT